MTTQVRERGTRWLRWMACASALWILGSSSARAATLYAAPAPVLNPAGSCLAGNPCTVSGALSQALDGDEIELAPGNYHFKNLLVDKDVVIRGAGSGGTVLDGNHNHRLFFIDAAAVTVRDVTFQNGHAVGPNVSDERGGAIYVENGGSLTLDGVEFLDNVADDVGGAVYSSEELTVKRCTFLGNSAQEAGALYMQGGEITDSSFEQNSAADGSAIQNWGALSIRGARFVENSGGPALRDHTEDTDIRRSLFMGNLEGAVVANSISPDELVIVNSTFSQNRGPEGAAIQLHDHVVAFLGNVTFFDNEASSGAHDLLVLGNSELTLNNSIIEHTYVPLSGNDLYCRQELNAPDPVGELNLVTGTSACNTLANFSIGAVTQLDGVAALNGGLTENHALLAGSNAISVGIDSCKHPRDGTRLETDQRLVTRDLAACSIGAYDP